MSKELVPTGPATLATRFVDNVMLEFSQQVGKPLSLTQIEKTLAQHLYLKIDSSLSALEAKRISTNNNTLPFVWQNINMKQLALDCAHRVNLGLDGLIPNHIHCIPYRSKHDKGTYDLDLRIGYVGELYCVKTAAMEQPKKIEIELVYSSDEFQAIKTDMKNESETYEFKIVKPFNRGEIIGGFGYIRYEDSHLNKLILVTMAEFKKAESMGNKDFWSRSRTDMMYKTIVHRVVKHIDLDPEKINSSFEVLNQEDSIDITPIEPIRIPEPPNNIPTQKTKEEPKKQVTEPIEIPVEPEPDDSPAWL